MGIPLSTPRDEGGSNSGAALPSLYRSVMLHWQDEANVYLCTLSAMFINIVRSVSLSVRSRFSNAFCNLVRDRAVSSFSFRS